MALLVCVSETRKSYGAKYMSRSLYLLLAGHSNTASQVFLRGLRVGSKKKLISLSGYNLHT